MKAVRVAFILTVARSRRGYRRGFESGIMRGEERVAPEQTRALWHNGTRNTIEDRGCLLTRGDQKGQAPRYEQQRNALPALRRARAYSR